MKVEQAVVKFIRSHKGLNPGERASYPLEEAGRLVSKGFAALDDPSKSLGDIGIPAEGDSPAGQAASVRTHEYTVPQAVELVEGIEDLTELQSLFDGEKDHPNHEGGRRGVLQAIQARAAVLKEAIENEQEEVEA